MTPHQFAAISARVNSIILYAEMGDREAVADGYTKLLDFMARQVK